MSEAIGLQKFTRFDGRLHVFQRPLTPFWWCGFHYKGRYNRISTKQADLSGAIAFAEKWFTLKQAEILTGSASFGGKPFTAAAKAALKNLNARVQRGERSPFYEKSQRLIIESKLVPYFGSKSVDAIGIVEWERYKEHCYAHNSNLARATLHQHKSALRTVLNEAYRSGWLKTLPVFKDVYGTDKIKVPRVWFEPDQYRKLLAALRQHKKTLKGTRWEADADELYDYVIFVTNSGLRVGEAKNVRFCDVSFHREVNDGEERQYLLIKNIKGKRGAGDCRSMDGAVASLERRVKVRKIEDPKTSTAPLFLAYHKDMFNAVLEKSDLKWTKDQPARKRDLTVLRHTYISFRLLYGASIYDVATNCRTSPQMIAEHYAKWISPQLMKGLNKLSRRGTSSS